jgi:hypothetical protein
MQIGCFVHWRDTTAILLELLPQEREEFGMFSAAIEVSQTQSAYDGCLTLRGIFQTFSSLHIKKTIQPDIDIHAAASNGFTERIEILSHLSGLVNFCKVQKQKKISFSR